VIVTRKAATDARVDQVHEQLARIARGIPRVSVRLEPDALVNADGSGATRPLASLRGLTVRAILSVADPYAFVAQLDVHGVSVIPRIFPDHHPFSPAEVVGLAGELDQNDVVICTLKDAVKLAPAWPRLAPPLWYVSQQVMVERGVGGLERVLDDLVRVRSGASPTAG
jgi:tetraacyldisaccharide 4'-kinase